MNKAKKFIFITLGLGTLLFYASQLFAKNDCTGKNIIIGDSHAVMIGSKLKNVIVDNRLAKSGWNISNVMTALNIYPISTDVCKIFISIGTNSGFNANDNIESFIFKLNSKFPNAEIFVFKGSYGWSGRWENPNAVKDMIPYYNRFSHSGVKILNNGLGYFATDAKAHSTNTPAAIAIINEINNIAK